MRVSFTIKFGASLTILVLGLVGFLMASFIAETRIVQKLDMEILGSHMINAGAYIFDEEAREDVALLRKEVLQAVVTEHADLQAEIEAKEKHHPLPLLDETSAARIKRDITFQSTVQLLRRLRASSVETSDRLDVISAREQAPSCSEYKSGEEKPAEGFVWTYLIAELPDVDPRDAVLILANSNPPMMTTGMSMTESRWSLFEPRSEIAEVFINGGIAVTDWYDSSFYRCSNVSSVAIPLRDEDGSIIALLGADYSVAHLESRIDEMKADYAALFVTSLVLVAVAVLLLLTWISVPLARLNEGAQQLEKGNYDFKIRLTQKDEFGFLASTLNRLGGSLRNLVDNMESEVSKRTKNLVAANERIEELNQLLSKESAYLSADVKALNALRKEAIESGAAELISRAIRFDNVVVEYHHCLSPVASGHFAATLVVDEERLVFACGDVAGNGIETVNRALQIQSILESSAELTETEVVEKVNRYLSTRSGVTGTMAALSILTLDSSGLSVTGGGFVVLECAADGEYRYRDQELIIGLDPEASWKTQSIDSASSTVLIMNAAMKTALTVVANESSQDVSASRLFELTGLAQRSASELMEEMSAYCYSADVHEDLSLVVVRRA